MFESKENKNNTMPSIYLVPNPVANEYMPLLYQIATSFVIPSRGEGWGRPHIEAMSIGLPVIATNWSGPTEFMNDKNSLLIGIDGYDTIKQGAFKGHQWAKPSLFDLKKQLKWVYINRKQALQIGLQAQKDVRQKYCIKCVGNILQNKIENIVLNLIS